MKKRAIFLAILTLAASLVEAARVTTLAIPSAKMERSVPATILLPDSYDESTGRFPVLYLLHGAGGSHASWAGVAHSLKLADEYGVIIVCPDGSPKSWYFDSPIDPAFQFETFVAKECVDYIDRHYRTKANRSSRALCGNSMGGHGALYLAIRHPETFGTAVALSGGVDIRPFPNNWDINKRLGTIETQPKNWEQHTVINLAKKLKGGQLAIALDCGEDDFFLDVNRALHNQLTADGINHHYEENPGKHNWEYWNEAIKRQMPFIVEQFKIP